MTRSNAADRCFAGAYVNDIRIGIRNPDCTDGADVEIVVGNVFPGNTGILGFPETTAGRTHVIQTVIVENAGHGSYASTAPRPDLAPLEPGNQIRIHRVRGQN